MPGSLGHLTSRFFEVLYAQPLRSEEVLEVESWLGPAQAWLFFSQTTPDQRHGYQAALVARDSGLGPTGMRAALLHDIGKRHARLGVVGRSIASLAIKTRLPLTKRWRLYRDHGLTGATELAALGSEPLVVEFARHHHGDRPPAIPERTWEALQLADQPAKTERKRAVE
ncbi:MAG TPA: HDIG domain-containing protein [Acidimicrobiia bacterium]|nr:HDIG domain-containing protein [Acidimicrobiia bacterium]